MKYKLLYEKLKQTVQNSIREGIEKLPAEAALCRQYQLSRQTVRQALGMLEADGLVVRVKGSGTYITGLLSDPELNKIALLLPNDREYLYPGLIYDIRKELTDHGFSSEVFLTGNSTYAERNILTGLLADTSRRGIIAEGCKSALPNPNLDLYQKLAKQNTHLVFLHHDYQLPGCPCIKDDNIGGSRLLVNHLTEQGHTSIGAVFKSDDLRGVERYLGFMETMRNLGQPVPDDRVVWYSDKELTRLENRHDTAFLQAAIRDSFAECSAVICQNDEIAYWLIRELRLAGYSLPEDMVITSFDNSYLNDTESHRLISLSHAPHAIGVTAAQTMIKKCRGLSAESQIIPWELRS